MYCTMYINLIASDIERIFGLFVNQMNIGILKLILPRASNYMDA